MSALIELKIHFLAFFTKNALEEKGMQSMVNGPSNYFALRCLGNWPDKHRAHESGVHKVDN